MSKEFDPNAAADADSGIFGLSDSYRDASVVYIPIPWEVTTSYGGGTSLGPAAILEASHQVDLFDLELGRIYERGLHMLEESSEIRSWNEEGKRLAAPIIAAGGRDESRSLPTINALSEKLNAWVYSETKKHLAAGKQVALIGGDHSSPLGAFRAFSEKYKNFGILHLDAHSDTRDAYEGFKYSHASIMFNALTEIPALTKLTQVGIRDFCEAEYDFCQKQGSRVSVFYDRKIQQQKLAGEHWNTIAKEICETLPENVFISFDIDGLDPRFCPNTGTPVPGGLEFSEAIELFRVLKSSGKRLVGFDLNEVAPDPAGKSEWDANVAARLLYIMTGYL